VLSTLSTLEDDKAVNIRTVSVPPSTLNVTSILGEIGVGEEEGCFDIVWVVSEIGGQSIWNEKRIERVCGSTIILKYVRTPIKSFRTDAVWTCSEILPSTRSASDKIQANPRANVRPCDTPELIDTGYGHSPTSAPRFTRIAA
jgi:hypothetical protein